MTYLNSNFIHPKIKDDTKEFKNREHTTFHKIKPNKEDLQALNKITEALVTTQPEIKRSLYLWEGQLCNLCDRYCVEKREIKGNRKPTQQLTSDQNGCALLKVKSPNCVNEHHK